ncbi:MAG: hypothetical protein UX74_C0003G0048, partial [Parcubacteria group bacterium GW2011_GWA2_47_10b]
MLINYREHQRGVWSRSIDYLIDYIFLAKYRRDHLTFLSGYNIAYADGGLIPNPDTIGTRKWALYTAFLHHH